MEAIFQITPHNGKIDVDGDLEKYFLEKEGITQTIMLRDAAKTSEKQLMYAYIFGPVMYCAVQGYTAAGYEGVDKVKARYMLEAELCKAEVYNAKTKKTEIYIESVSGMSKKRLHKFLNDVLLFLELELKQQVPDAEGWKAKLLTGKNFREVKK